MNLFYIHSFGLNFDPAGPFLGPQTSKACIRVKMEEFQKTDGNNRVQLQMTFYSLLTLPDDIMKTFP